MSFSLAAVLPQSYKICLVTQRLKLPNLAPLKKFDYALVRAPLDGLLINVDRDLQRRAGQAERIRDRAASRCLTLLDVMVRFSANSFRAVRYVIAETPEDHNRKPSYSLVLAPVNRQLLDLLFSLVFMLDDFEERSLRYQKAGWREMTEEYHKFKSTYRAMQNVTGGKPSRHLRCNPTQERF